MAIVSNPLSRWNIESISSYFSLVGFDLFVCDLLLFQPWQIQQCHCVAIVLCLPVLRSDTRNEYIGVLYLVLSSLLIRSILIILRITAHQNFLHAC